MCKLYSSHTLSEEHPEKGRTGLLTELLPTQRREKTLGGPFGRHCFSDARDYGPAWPPEVRRARGEALGCRGRPPATARAGSPRAPRVAEATEARDTTGRVGAWSDPLRWEDAGPARSKRQQPMAQGVQWGGAGLGLPLRFSRNPDFSPGRSGGR